MFLSELRKQNPELIDYAFKLHQTGEILPDTYVIDLDMIISNTEKIVAEAKRNNVELLYMTKQIGRNPVIAKAIEEAGIESAVVVDYREAEIFMQNGLHLGNVGHLVQPPRKILKQILEYGTKYVTMYSIENLRFLNETALKLNIKQNVLLKVTSLSDDIYPGQMGGFSLPQLKDQLDEIKKMRGVKIVGVTTFPAVLFNDKTKKYEPTSNLETVNAAKELLKSSGIDPEVISLPSATSVSTLKLISDLGGNEAEPGHALTGTTPIHAISDQPERPAYCYVSEVAHNFNEHSYIFGGGLYRRGHLKHALIKESSGLKEANVIPLENSNIDYHLELDKKFEPGSAVIMASRTQIFVTRSTVAVVKGLHGNGNPKLIGLYDSQGKELPEGMR